MAAKGYYLFVLGGKNTTNTSTLERAYTQHSLQHVFFRTSTSVFRYTHYGRPIIQAASPRNVFEGYLRNSTHERASLKCLHGKYKAASDKSGKR